MGGPISHLLICPRPKQVCLPQKKGGKRRYPFVTQFFLALMAETGIAVELVKSLVESDVESNESVRVFPPPRLPL